MAYKNKDFIYIETCSGYSSAHNDPKGKKYFLAPSAADVALGGATINALMHSRFLLPKDDPKLFSFQKTAERYDRWVAETMKKYDYKSKRAMLKDMHLCNIVKVSGMMTIKPTRHEKLDGWSGTGLKGADHVTIPDSSSPAEVGAALRLAFSRCR